MKKSTRAVPGSKRAVQRFLASSTSLGVRSLASAIVLGVGLCLLPWQTVHADHVISLTPRPNVTLDLLVWEPLPKQIDTVIFLLPGGPGNLGILKVQGQVKAESPYLYSRQRAALMRAGVAVVVLNAPSDQPDQSQDFRLSAVHAKDLSVALTAIHQRFSGARLVLMAHSRGTISASQILQNSPEQISAAILFAGLYRASQAGPTIPSAGPGLSQVNWASIKTPVLAIHHTSDACPVAPFAGATQTPLPLISIQGQSQLLTESPCGPATPHWFAGNESALASEIFAWLAGQAWRKSLP